MLLIPVGQENSEVRRNPWVSYSIIAANLVVFLFLFAASQRSNVPERFRVKAREVAEYLGRNPYLTIPPELAPLVTEEGLALFAEARASAPRPIDWVVRRQQQKLNTLTAELFVISRESPILRHGFVPREPDPFAILTSMFVHGGWVHLIGNMLFFFAVGPFLEDVVGRFFFTLLYLLSGAAALAAHAWQNPGSMAPVVGASGAVAGIMGAFLIRLGTSRIRFLCIPIILLPWIRFRFLVPAFIVLPLWFLQQFWLANNAADYSGVAFWAHVGGFAFGAAAALLIRALGVERRWIHPAIEAQVSWSQNAELVRAIEANARGDEHAAREATSRALREDPKNLDARRYAYDMALEARDWPELAAQATRLLELYIDKGEDELAKGVIHQASSESMDSLPLRFHLRAASFLEKRGEKLRAIKFYDWIANRHAADLAALRALLRTAEILAGSGDTAGARQALRRAEAHPECAGEWKAAVARKLAGLAGTPGFARS